MFKKTQNELYFSFKLTRRERDLDSTVYNSLLSTVLMLQNIRGALFIFLCLR